MNVVEQEFNGLAPEYESNRLADWYQAHAELMLKQCAEIAQGDILDVGCGTGYLLRHYLKDKPGLRAVGIDISSTMVEVARKKAHQEGMQNIEFLHGDWESLDPALLKDYNFKLVFCANAFHYFSEPQAATDRLFNQLAEGGTLYMLERNKARSLMTFIWGILHTVLIKDQVVFYKTSDLVDFFNKAGFKPIKVLSSIKKYFWKNKTFTSIVLIEGKKP